MRKLSTIVGTIAVTGALFIAGCDTGTEDFEQDPEPRSQMDRGQERDAQRDGMSGTQQQQRREQEQQPDQRPMGEQGDAPYQDGDYEDYNDEHGEDSTDPWQ